MKTGAYEALLSKVMQVTGIRGALVVAVKDGLIVDGRVHVGVHGEAVAALAASLFRRACRATGAKEGQTRFVELDADAGRILMVGRDELALLAVLDRRANPGQARLAVRRAGASLSESGGVG